MEEEHIRNFALEMVESIWKRDAEMEGLDSNLFRKDACGAVMARSQYGMRDSNFGWEIDHVYPIAMGGDDNIENLRAMQWENVESKGSDFPVYKSAVSFKGFENVEDVRNKKVNSTLVKGLMQIYPLIEP